MCVRNKEGRENGKLAMSTHLVVEDRNGYMSHGHVCAAILGQCLELLPGDVAESVRIRAPKWAQNKLLFRSHVRQLGYDQLAMAMIHLG